MSWRDAANGVIRKVLEEHKPITEKEARRLLREAYPFGQRAMHPYKIWCDAVNKAMKKAFGVPEGKQLEINVGLFSNDWLPPPIDIDEEVDFEPCGNCDLPDACADFGCAIKQGLRPDSEFN